MILDFNAHVGCWPEIGLDFTEDNLISLMDKNSIDKAVICNPNNAFGQGKSNLTNDRLIRFTCIAPDFEETNFDGSLGIRVYPGYHNWDFAASNWNKLVEAAEEKKLIFQITLKVRDGRRLPLKRSVSEMLTDLGKTLKNHPGIRFVLSGINSVDIPGFEDLLGLDNVWADTAYLQHLMNPVNDFVSVVGENRVLLGTNTPFFNPGAEIFRDRNCDLSETVIHKIFWQNSAGLLNKGGQ